MSAMASSVSLASFMVMHRGLGARAHARCRLLVCVRAPPCCVGDRAGCAIAGCDDEDAGSDEMAERILFYHPPGTPVDAQLDHMSYCEALIDFAR